MGAYRQDLNDLERFLVEYYGTPDWAWSRVDRLSLRSFLGWCSARGLAKRTIARKLSGVRSFFHFLHGEGRIPTSPASGIRQARGARRLPAYLQQRSTEGLFQLAETDLTQEIYGVPDWLGALQSGLLNESATIFRRRYFANGSHAGYILYVNEERFADAAATSSKTRSRIRRGRAIFGTSI